MGAVGPFEREKLVVGVMYADPIWYSRAMERLVGMFGPADCTMDEYSFSRYTTFYNPEMGGPVFKRFVSFERLADPSSLAQIKLSTNEVERMLAQNGARRANIDPCLLGHGKFVMATTKNASFRIPLGCGIYAELSLLYAKGGWREFFWTYHDVRSDAVKEFLGRVRNLYLAQRGT